MRKDLVLAIEGVCLLGGALHVRSAEFQPIGSVPLSMGGAGVAAASGPYAAYFNPALLGRPEHGAQFALAVGVGYREVNLVDAADRLSDIDIQDSLDELELRGGAPIGGQLQQDLITIQEELSSLSARNGFQLMPTLSLGMQIGRIGFGAYGVCEATGYAVIDKSRLAFVVEHGGRYFAYDPTSGVARETNSAEYERTSLQYAIDNRLTYIQLTGLAYMEIPLAYGHTFETKGKSELSVGGALKIMPGITYDMRIDVDTESDELKEEFENADKTGVSYGVDVGLLFRPSVLKSLAVGVVGKNLNSPSFDTVKGDKLEVEPQFRAGIALDVFDRLTVAVDADLSRNKTYLPDLQSQFVGGGLNFHPASWFSLRCGAMQNIAESDDGTIITAGLGLGLKWFQLDISGQFSTEQSEYDGNSVPRVARVQVALVSKWR